MAADPSSISEEMGPISAINVTPFVDVVLVLLVIFMVTAPVLMKDAIGITLPKSAAADAKAIHPIGVAVTKQGQILLDGQLADPAGITAQLQARLQAEPDVQALISADADARHGDVVRAIDLVKSAGITHFAIQIQRP